MERWRQSEGPPEGVGTTESRPGVRGIRQGKTRWDAMGSAWERRRPAVQEEPAPESGEVGGPRSERASETADGVGKIATTFSPKKKKKELAGPRDEERRGDRSSPPVGGWLISCSDQVGSCEFFSPRLKSDMRIIM
jgi:hypothetical protein